MSRLANRSGDTLIEVIFAFAILGMIIGLSFTGVIGGRRSAVAAQERTQATFLAQYQAEALKAYRNSLDWDSVSAGGGDSFLDGSAVGSVLPKIKTVYLTPNVPFCMQQPSSTTKWAVVNVDTCNTDPMYATLVQDGSNNRVTIRLTSINTDTISATVNIHWLDAQRRPADVIQQVTLTKAK